MKDTQIRALKAENGKTKRRAISNGLFIEARPSGKKVFIFRYQWNQKPQTITLGQYPTLTLGEASAIALQYQELLLKDIDPRSKDSEEPRKLTFSEVAEQWHQKNKHLWKDVTKNRHYKSLLRDIYNQCMIKDSAHYANLVLPIVMFPYLACDKLKLNQVLHDNHDDPANY